MKRALFALAIPALLLTGNTLAQSISPAPQPGLWRSEATTLINGQDAQAAMREAYEQMMAQFPEEQRAQMAEALGVNDLSVDMECISAEDAAAMTNPQKLLAEAKQDMEGCDIDVKQAGDSRLTFSGTCHNNEGFSGDMQGELVMVSSREMRSKFSGKGNYQALTEPGMVGTPDSEGGPVDIQHTEVSRWISADCGDVPRQPR
ncbi:DUF3617 domain-containing protein [Pseudomonas sp.]|uniref:DUF3617 domain-containing protein n=1 Tax=Pseudomonas sp. TaxID=306 RepID=UPI00272C6E6C|nr:DUF3617 family protein [Pseudomonas sp.]